MHIRRKMLIIWYHFCYIVFFYICRNNGTFLLLKMIKFSCCCCWGCRASKYPSDIYVYNYSMSTLSVVFTLVNIFIHKLMLLLLDDFFVSTFDAWCCITDIRQDGFIDMICSYWSGSSSSSSKTMVVVTDDG